MSVLISGMEMPAEGTVIAIYKLKGQFFASVHGTELCPLIPVPKHGRLIDADALIIALETQDYSCAPDTLEEWTPMDMTIAEIEDIRNAPTIIEGDEHE